MRSGGRKLAGGVSAAPLTITFFALLGSRSEYIFGVPFSELNGAPPFAGCDWILMSSSMSAYAGDVTPQDAWATLEGDEASALVDVRTVAEWTFVGVPELGDVGKRALLKEWQSYPSGQVDAAFVDKVGSELSAAGLSKDAPVFFLCRSGARSQAAAAAMAAAGWSRCFNVVGGFEGPPNAERHRGSTAGWKADGLPWSQS